MGCRGAECLRGVVKLNTLVVPVFVRFCDAELRSSTCVLYSGPSVLLPVLPLVLRRTSCEDRPPVHGRHPHAIALRLLLSNFVHLHPVR